MRKKEDYAVDTFGRRIYVGDDVVYPGRKGSSMWLNHATVVESRNHYIIVENYNSSFDRKSRVTRLDRVVIIDTI